MRLGVLIAVMLASLLAGGCDKCRSECQRLRGCLEKQGEKITAHDIATCEWYCKNGSSKHGMGDFKTLIAKTCALKLPAQNAPTQKK